MDVLTGRLFVNKTLDRDQKALHILSIHARNSNPAQSQPAGTLPWQLISNLSISIMHLDQMVQSSFV